MKISDCTEELFETLEIGKLWEEQALNSPWRATTGVETTCQMKQQSLRKHLFHDDVSHVTKICMDCTCNPSSISISNADDFTDLSYIINVTRSS